MKTARSCKTIHEIAANSRFPPEIQAQRLHNVIEHELTETQKKFVQAIYFDGMTYRKAAYTFGVQPSSVYRCVHRALNRIARCLKY